MNTPPRIDEDDDDWAPLTAEQLAMRPGEWHGEAADAAAEVSAAQPEEPVPAFPAPPKPGTKAHPRADEMLRELQARCVAKGPSDSLVSSVQRRTDREVRKRRASVARAGQLAETVGRGDPRAAALAREATRAPRPEPAPAPVGRDAVGDVDPREREEWFTSLPDAEQARLRSVWSQKRGLQQDCDAQHRRNGYHRMVAAWVCFVATVLAGSGYGWHATLGGGVICGFWWRHAAPDRILDPLRALGCMLVPQAVAMFAADQSNPALGFDAVFLVAAAAIVGFDGEIRQTGGFDQRHRAPAPKPERPSDGPGPDAPHPEPPSE